MSPEPNGPRRAAVIDEVGKDLRAPRAAGVAGLLFAILFIGVLVFVRAPAAAPGETLSQWYGSGTARTRIVLMGLYAIPLAGIAFLWFIGAVRARIGSREDQLFATVFLGSGLLFVAMLFAAAATASAMALRLDMLASTTEVDPGVMQFSQALTYTFLYVYAARAAGVFMIVTSTIAIRTKTVPRWVGFVGYAIALALLLSIQQFQLIMTLFPLWVALLSIFILVSPPAGDPAEKVTAEPGSAE
jgi:hypothetical protein